jgi:signal transduction histidine kinase
MTSGVAAATDDVMASLARLEQDLASLGEGPERVTLRRGLAALREAIERRQAAEREERHRLGHDLRVPLNAIAGWTHILKMDAGSPSTVTRAVEVLHRNVQALARLIDSSERA